MDFLRHWVLHCRAPYYYSAPTIDPDRWHLHPSDLAMISVIGLLKKPEKKSVFQTTRRLFASELRKTKELPINLTTPHVMIVIIFYMRKLWTLSRPEGFNLQIRNRPTEQILQLVLRKWIFNSNVNFTFMKFSWLTTANIVLLWLLFE